MTRLGVSSRTSATNAIEPSVSEEGQSEEDALLLAWITYKNELMRKQKVDHYTLHNCEGVLGESVSRRMATCTSVGV